MELVMLCLCFRLQAACSYQLCQQSRIAINAFCSCAGMASYTEPPRCTSHVHVWHHCCPMTQPTLWLYSAPSAAWRGALEASVISPTIPSRCDRNRHIRFTNYLLSYKPESCKQGTSPGKKETGIAQIALVYCAFLLQS